MSANVSLPLTSAQQGIYFDQLIRPNSNCYNIAVCIPIYGMLDVSAMKKALNSMVEEFDILGVEIEESGGEARQVFGRHNSMEVDLIDFREQSQSNQAASNWVQERLSQSFKIGRDRQLYESAILHVNDEEYWWFFRLHHIITDAFCFPFMMHYVSDAYQCLIKGLPITVDSKCYDYSLEVAENLSYLSSDKYEKDRLYWKNKFSSAPEQILTPKYDQGKNSHYLCFDIPKSVTDKLESLSNKSGESLQIIGLSFLSLFLSKEYGVEQTVIGVPLHKRKSHREKRTVGMYAGDVPCDISVNKADTLYDLIKISKKELRTNYRHQLFPMHHLNNSLDYLDGAVKSISSVTFNYIPFDAAMNFIDGEKDFNRYSGGPDPLQVRLTVPDGNKASQLEFFCDSEYFNEKESVDFAEKFQKFFEFVSSLDLDAKIDAINWMDEGEQHKLIHEFNDNNNRDFLSRSWPDLFSEQVEKTPHDIAVSCQERKLTYAELDRRSNILARALQEKSIGSGSLVALLDHRDIELMIMVVAVLKSGAAYLPLDPEHPSERWLAILSEGSPDLLLIGDALSLEKRWLMRKWDNSKVIDYASLESLQADDSSIEEYPKVNDLAYVIYTSGSTGTPKGVMIEHRGMINNILSKREPLQLTNSDVIAQTASQCFDISVWQFLAALVFGAKTEIIPNDVSKSPEYLLKHLAENKVTIWEPVPSVIQAVLDYSIPLPNLKWILSTGEALTCSLVKQWFLQYPQIPIMNAYGPAECSDDVAFYPIHEPVDRVLIGKPLPNAKFYVLDRSLSLVTNGTVGELAISGAVVGRGYLNLPEQTERVFRDNPFSIDNLDKKIYLTSDLVKRHEDGSLEFVGRKDHQLKVRGFRIEAAEVESKILSISGIKDVVVTTFDDGRLARLVAYVVLESVQGTAIDRSSIRERLKPKLPGYMIPESIVVLDKMPLNNNGKIDRKALPKPDFHSDRRYVSPKTPTERTLANIWEQILDIDQIGVTDNFFEVGGHSLLASKLISQIKSEWSVEISLKILFESENLLDLAKLIDQSVQSTIARITPANTIEPIPLSYSQQRLWFIDSLNGGSSEYNMGSAFKITGDLNFDAFKKSLSQLVQRHKILHSVYYEKDGDVYQRPKPVVSVECPITHLADVKGEKLEAEINKLSIKHLAKPFDLSSDPMLRAEVLVIEESSEYILLITIHHIASDGWSEGILINELSQIYSSNVKGDNNGLPDLPLQYSDYAFWQKEHLSDDILQEHLSFWRERLEEMPSVHSLPLDFSRPARINYSGARYKQTLSKELSLQVKALCQAENTTLFMVIYAVYATLLSQYSNENDIVIGTPVANRDQADIADLVGFFVNTLLLRCQLDRSKTFLELLSDCREWVLEAYQHQQLPFEVLVENLQPQRSLSHNPLFQIMLAVQNNDQRQFSLPDLSLTPIEIPCTTTQFDLLLEVKEENDELTLCWEYASDLFSLNFIQQMARSFESILKDALEHPNKAVLSTSLLSSNDQAWLLDASASLSGDFPSNKLIHELFEEQESRTPNRIAVVDGDLEITYFELNRRANQLAYRLIEEGVEPGNFVGLCIDRSIDMVVALLAILKAGGAYVPFDSKYPQTRLDYMVEDSGVSLVILQSSLKEKFNNYNVSKVVLDASQGQVISGYPTNNLNLSCLPASQQVAYINYTSGSTGQPKGVLTPHIGVVRLTINPNYVELNADTVFIQLSSVSFDAATLEIWGALLNGGKTALYPPTAIDVSELNHLIQKHDVNTMFLTSALFDVWSVSSTNLDSLKWVMFGGDIANPKAVERAYDHLPEATIINCYGPTENTTFTCCYHIPRSHDFNTTVPLGTAINGTKNYVLDTQLALRPAGCIGELYTAGYGVALGYHEKQELTDKVFIKNPFYENEFDTLYKTGDLVKMNHAGQIEFVGRVDDQVKIRGFRIELGEVEHHILNCSVIKSADVFVKDVSTSEKTLVAYLVPNQFDQEHSYDVIDQVKRALKSVLPDYSIPSAFVVLSEFPLNNNGKIDRSALPEPDMSSFQIEHVAPETCTEIALVKVWSGLLRCEEGRISVTANFFDLGGHSLLAVRLISEVMSVFHVELSMKSVFELNSLRLMAEHIDFMLNPVNDLPAENNEEREVFEL